MPSSRGSFKPRSPTLQVDSLPSEPPGKPEVTNRFTGLGMIERVPEELGTEEELKSLLMKVKEQSEKACLKLNIQKTKIMASSPITSWQIDRETVETVTDFIFGGLQNHCRYEIKRCLLLGRKGMTNLDSILKISDITNKGSSSQSYGFSSNRV